MSTTTTSADHSSDLQKNTSPPPPKIIKFHRATTNYGWLSNFSVHPIHINEVTWRTNEHYYQAQKFVGTEMVERLRGISSPGKVKRMGNDPNGPARLRKDWNKVKEYVMYEALLAKFTQHPSLKEKLLQTGDAILVESTSKDRYWGDGGDGTGLNRLGSLLMNLRNQLRQSPSLSLNTTAITSNATVTSTTNLTEPTTVPSGSPDGVEKDDPTESFSESDDGLLNGNPNATDEKGEEEEEEEDHFSVPYATLPAAFVVASNPTSAQKARKKRNLRSKMRKNVWKDETGGSLFAKDNQVSGQIEVKNTGIQIPVSSLPPSAKLVVHQNQVRRKWEKDSDEDEDDLGEDPRNDQEDNENVSSRSRSTLGDFLSVKTKQQNTIITTTTPEYLTSPSACICSTIENITLYRSLSRNDALFEEIEQNLRDLKSALLQFVQQPQTEQITQQLLEQIETLNDMNL